VFRKIVFAAVPLAAASLLALSAAASASVSPNVKWTSKAHAAVAGYYAQATGQQDPVAFTHATSYLGNDGQSNQEKFTPSAPPAIQNGGGIGLCDQSTSEAVQVGDVYVGGGQLNVVYGFGHFGAPVNNGDPCENGIVAPTAGHVLLTGIPVNDTVRVDILYDGHHAHNGCHAGQVLFLAQDLSASGPLARSYCIWMPHGTEFTEGDAGVVADTTNVASIPDLVNVPLPDTFRSENLLMTFAHVAFNANSLTGGPEVKGSLQSSPFWTAFPVASTNNGQPVPAGSLLLATGQFRSDHFRVYVGDATS
jgi:hypothetical protein